LQKVEREAVEQLKAPLGQAWQLDELKVKKPMVKQLELQAALGFAQLAQVVELVETHPLVRHEDWQLVVVLA